MSTSSAHLPIPNGPTPGVEPAPASGGSSFAGSMIDAETLRRARAGDAAAREDLARRSGEAAFRFALQLLGDRESARDVAQDSVMRFFAALDRVDPERSPAPWLLRIVRNRVIDLRRHERARGGAPPRGSDGAGFAALELPDRSPGPLERSVERELQRLVWQCLAGLEPAHREILVLRDYQDLSYRDIALVLEIPIGTVMSRLHAARRLLRAAVLATGYRFGGAA